MGNYKLQVVEACSGLRYLYPLLSLSFLAAYLFHAPFWQRILVFLSSIPIAIGMNGFRIGLVGILVDRWGNQMAEGVLHFFEGWVIFLACAALLAAEINLGTHFGEEFLRRVLFSEDCPEANASKLGRKVRGNPLIACLILLCAGGLAIYFVSGRTEIIPDRTRFVGFPDRMGEWQGHTAIIDSATEKALEFDDYILSDYSRPDGKAVNLYVAYYASQRKGESPHSPMVCIPGGGWAITNLQEINYDNQGEAQPLNRVIIEKGTVKQIVYYWFDERGRQIANEWWAKFYLLADAIVKNRTDGALVRLTTLVLPGETDRTPISACRPSCSDAVPRLAEFLPADAASSSGRPPTPAVASHRIHMFRLLARLNVNRRIARCCRSLWLPFRLPAAVRRHSAPKATTRMAKTVEPASKPEGGTPIPQCHRAQEGPAAGLAWSRPGRGAAASLG